MDWEDENEGQRFESLFRWHCNLIRTRHDDWSIKLVIENQVFQRHSWAYTSSFLSIEIKKRNTKNTHIQSLFFSLFSLGSGSIDSYQKILHRISFVSKSPIEYVDRTFSLICMGAHDQSSTNEIRIQVKLMKVFRMTNEMSKSNFLLDSCGKTCCTSCTRCCNSFG